ncbi:MAG: phosphoribosylanthranilate isomerase [Bdellovibrionales bacterium]
MTVEVKICGINDEPGLRAALEAGARYVGFVFYPPSRNIIGPDDAAKLAALVPPHVTKTGLFVDAANDDMRAVLARVPLDLIQLHGKETPQRVTEVRELAGKPVMMAIRLMEPAHLDRIPAYETVADRLLFDSRMGAEASGGPIDWTLLKGRSFKKPWLLAGGLTARNLAEAVAASGAKTVDVSSGVEDSPGRKSPDKIREFIKLAAGL